MWLAFLFLVGLLASGAVLRFGIRWATREEHRIDTRADADQHARGHDDGEA